MHGGLYNDQQLNQTQILETLRTVSLAEMLAILVQKGGDYAPIFDKIKHQFEQLQPLREQFQSMSETDYLRQVTFNRFSSRLHQIIYLHSIKYKESAQSPSLQCFLLSLNEIQTAIKKHQENRRLLDIIKIIQLSLIKFCINCKKNARIIDEDQQAKCEEAFFQLKQSVIKFNRFDAKKPLIKKVSLEEQVEDEEAPESERSKQTHPMSLTSVNKIPNFNKQLSDLQGRFDSLKGLDLDFSHFRSDYFMAKNTHDAFFKQYMRKNQPNRRLITEYHDDFYLFCQKKVNREHKKNRKRPVLGSKAMTHSSIAQVNTLRQLAENALRQTKEFTLLSQNKSYQSYGSPLNCEKIKTIQGQDEKGSLLTVGGQNPKKQLQMNNIQIYLGRPKGNKPAKGNVMKQISKIKAMGINNSFELPLNSKDQLCFPQGKLRLDSKSRQLYKVQVESQLKPSQSKAFPNEGLKKESDSVVMAIKSRSTFKNKYLEINCMSRNQGPDHRGRVIKNQGSITKVSLRSGYPFSNNQMASNFS